MEVGAGGGQGGWCSGGDTWRLEAFFSLLLFYVHFYTKSNVLMCKYNPDFTEEDVSL